MERSCHSPRVPQLISDEARILRHLGSRTQLLILPCPLRPWPLCGMTDARFIEERKRGGEARETEEDWQALDWALRYRPSPALKEHTAHYRSGHPLPTGTDLAHSRHSGLNTSQMTGDKSDGCAQDPTLRSKRLTIGTLPTIFFPTQRYLGGRSQATYPLCVHVLRALRLSKVEPAGGEKRAGNLPRKSQPVPDPTFVPSFFSQPKNVEIFS